MSKGEQQHGRRCPICGEESAAESPASPFCSERCRLVDLGRWFSGRYVVSREATAEEMTDAPSPRPTGEGAGD